MYINIPQIILLYIYIYYIHYSCMYKLCFNLRKGQDVTQYYFNRL